MSEDARVRYTKMMIQNSFIQLVREKPFSKIKLKEVCELAGINHSTFYRYYKDIFDWKEQLEAACRERTLMIIENGSLTNIRDILIAQLQDFLSAKELYSMMTSDNFESTIIQQSYALCISKAESALKEVILSNPQGKEKWDCYYTVHGAIGVMECWIKDGMIQPPEEVADYMLSHTLSNFKEYQG